MIENIAPFHARFSLSVTEALRAQLVEGLSQLIPTPLTENYLDNVLPRPGIYTLHNGGDLVYIGKADRNLRQRLSKHRTKLLGRIINSSDIYFKCLYVDEDFSAVAPEKTLIDHYSSNGVATWNNNGFGNNDPGRRRDQSLVKENHFDHLHPINLDAVIDLGSGEVEVDLTTKELALKIKEAAPYLFRYNPLMPESGVIEVDSNEMTVKGALSLLASTLPIDWSIVALPGYVIAYPGDEVDNYPSRIGHWHCGPSSAGMAEHSPKTELD